MERPGWRAGDLRWRWLLGVVVIALLASRLIVLQGNSAGGEAPGLSTSDRPDRSEVVRAMGQLPRGFVENAGQWDPEAGWSAPGFYGVTWITRNGELRHALVSRGDCAAAPETAAGESPTGVSEQHSCETRIWVLSEHFAGGRVSEVRGEEPLPAQVSYFVGGDPAKHRTGLPGYRRLSLGEVWPGVVIELKATQRTVEKIFKVEPFADPSVIRVALQGAEALRLNEHGELVVSTGYGDVVFSKPIAWQEEGATKKAVQVNYRIDAGTGTYAFALGDYDHTRPLFIDPILQSTYLGGSAGDSAHALAISGSGEIYVAGHTASANFPNTSGGAQPGHAGDYDVFVARLSPDLRTLYQATYLGGSGLDGFNVQLAISSAGDVYVVGWTDSNDFPGTPGGAQPSSGGYTDAFVAKLDMTLQTLIQATYLGGSLDDEPAALALSPAGDLYVAGRTFSANFPAISGGAQTSRQGLSDAFVARIRSDLTTGAILQATYLGGSDEEDVLDVVVANSGDVYVAGWTSSANFPGTAGGAQASFAGVEDAFVTILNSGLTSIIRSTYLGGNSFDRAVSIAMSSSGVYVGGVTGSSDFPVTAGVAQPTFGGGDRDGFVAKIRPDLGGILQATYLGGSGWDAARVAVAGSGDVYVAGPTDSTDFPGTSGGAQESYAGGYRDGYVARLRPDLSAVLQATYLGGNDWDSPDALVIAPSGDVYVAGYTESPNLPVTSGGAQPTFGGLSDGFVARLTADLAATPTQHRLYLPLVVKGP